MLLQSFDICLNDFLLTCFCNIFCNQVQWILEGSVDGASWIELHRQEAWPGTHWHVYSTCIDIYIYYIISYIFTYYYLDAWMHTWGVLCFPKIFLNRQGMCVIYSLSGIQYRKTPLISSTRTPDPAPSVDLKKVDHAVAPSTFPADQCSFLVPLFLLSFF